ncbi:MAG: DUF975 family protein [Oscillospiraceae bacterium]|nr:DUF975 family protein [Oscillospiraceae bacterium]
MKSRQEIKALAKDAFKAQYGTAVLLQFVLLLVIAAVTLIAVFLGLIPIIGWLLTIAAMCFVLVLAVNEEGAFVKIWRRESVEVGTPFNMLSVNFFRKLGGMWWMMLWVYLWMLLLIVPGIIKSLAYSMTPYILADCPNVTARNALKLSMRMTNGHKGKLFVLALSFIGWGLLTSLTAGILGIFYTGPYIFTTYAGYYAELRDNALESGVITQAELDGAIV